MKRTGKTHWERFAAAVAAHQDEAAEALVPLLTAQDRPRLHGWLAADPDRRWWAVRGLAEVGGEEDVARVANLLDAPEPDLRLVALMALGRMLERGLPGVTELLPRIAERLADDDGLVRQTAGDVLARAGDAAVDVLAAALDGPEEALRVRAAAALRKIATPKTAPLLYRHLDDPNPLVQHHAYEALDEMGYLNNLFFAP